MGSTLTGLEAAILWHTCGASCWPRSTWLWHILSSRQFLLQLLLLHRWHNGYMSGIGTAGTGHLRGTQILVVGVHGRLSSLIHSAVNCCWPLDVSLVTDGQRCEAGSFSDFQRQFRCDKPARTLSCTLIRSRSLFAWRAACTTLGYPLQLVSSWADILGNTYFYYNKGIIYYLICVYTLTIHNRYTSSSDKFNEFVTKARIDFWNVECPATMQMVGASVCLTNWSWSRRPACAVSL